MPLDTSVHYFRSTHTGAPTLTGQAGSFIALLDATLVNGWGTGTVDSVVISGGVATVTRGGGHPFEIDMVCEIAGATVTGGTLNGERKVLSVISATQYTIDADGIPNQTATGTITHKVAPAGWQKVFTGTNLAVYRSLDVTGNRFYLRVDDTGTTLARFVGYETMSDVNTGTGVFPTSIQQSGGFYFPKSQTGDATARAWFLIADRRTFYLGNQNLGGAGGTAYALSMVFGDAVRVGSTDNYASICGGHNISYISSSPGSVTDLDVKQAFSTVGSGSNIVFARANHGIGTSIYSSRWFDTFVVSNNGTRSGAVATEHLPFPNAADGGLYIAKWKLTDSTNNYRGDLPGFFALPAQIGASVFPVAERLTGIQNFTGRALRVFNSASGCFSFDVTGPWR